MSVSGFGTKNVKPRSHTGQSSRITTSVCCVFFPTDNTAYVSGLLFPRACGKFLAESI